MSARRACPAIFLALAAAPLADCREPTQITVLVTTDVECPRVVATSVAVGPVEGLDARPASAETTFCRNGTVGALVVVPSASNTAEVALRVVMGLDGKSPDDCVKDGFTGGCIVARRALRFLPHEPLEVPVELRGSCKDVACDATAALETCLEGQCASATIPDPSACQGSGCDIDRGDGGGSADAVATPDVLAADGGGSPACDLAGAEPGAAWPMIGYCAAHRARSRFRGPKTAPAPAQMSPGVQWATYLTANRLFSPLVDANGAIYVVGATGATATVFVIDQATAATLWSYASTDKIIKGLGALGADGTLYVPQGSSVAGVSPGGAPKWAPYAVPNGVAGSLTVSPTGDIVFHDATTKMMAIHPDGTSAWAAPFDAMASLQYALPAIDSHGAVYFSDDGGSVIGIDAAGQRLFLQTYAGIASDTMALAPDGTLRIVSDGNGQPNVDGFFTRDGGALFGTKLPMKEDFDLALGDDGTTYFGLEDNLLHAYGPGGASAWTSAATAAVGPFGSPTIDADGTIYVGGGNAMLYAFTPAGALLWSSPTTIPPANGLVIESAPVIGSDGALYVTATTGDLMKFGP